MPRSPEQGPQSPRSMRTGPGHHSATSWGLPSWAVLPPTHCARSYGVRSQRATKKTGGRRKSPPAGVLVRDDYLSDLESFFSSDFFLSPLGGGASLPDLRSAS